jgi:CRP/FNR family transcriptional regulator, cyclic AMP receptor protein
MKVHSMAKWRWLEHVRDREQLLRLKVLENVPLFAGLSRRQLGKLLVKFFEKEYPSGDTIFGQGEPGKALFIVLTGRVAICRALKQGEELLATLTAGGYFGELALIDDQPRFASVRAVEPSVLLILYKSDFDDLIEGHRTLAIRVMGNLLKTLAVYVRRAQSQANGGNSVNPGRVSAPDQDTVISGSVPRD